MARNHKKKGATAKSMTLPLLVLAVVVLSTFGAMLYFLFLRPVFPLPAMPSPAAERQAIPARLALSPPKPAAEPAAPEKSEKPLLAIVIDDMGNQNTIDNEMLALDLNLSFAFLPFGAYTAEQARTANLKERDVLLHLPLEPTSKQQDPGPGGLFLSMSPAELTTGFKKALAGVPTVIGINNHMGSRFTENQEAMDLILHLIRQNNLFFLDSRTSPASLGYLRARAQGIRTGRRDIFLDNIRRQKEISLQLDALIRLAHKNGSAIGIAHPNIQTLKTLTENQNRLNTEVEVVGIHFLMH